MSTFSKMRSTRDCTLNYAVTEQDSLEHALITIRQPDAIISELPSKL